MVVLSLTKPEWLGGFVYAWFLVLAIRFVSTFLSRLRPGLLGLWAVGRQLGLAGMAIGGIFWGLNPIGVALGLFLWPLSLWIWTARHVLHGR